MDLLISPSHLSGTVEAIPSKSDVHRLLICAALARGRTVIECPAASQDIEATVRCLRALGAVIEYSGGCFTVTPIAKPHLGPTLDCGESGSTLRFLLPVAAALCSSAEFIGGGRLPDRPIADLRAAMEEAGAVFSRPRLPFSVLGPMSGRSFTLPGNVSSQYVTGLLFALGAMGGGEIRLTTPLESEGYVDMTLGAMERFGVDVHKTPQGYRVLPMIFVSPGAVKAEGDWSNAAFFLIAGALNRVRVTGLEPRSAQGDKEIIAWLRSFGARVEAENGDCTVSPGTARALRADIRQTPDMLPALAVLATLGKGTSEFSGCGRLRLKESDRLITVRDMILGLGGCAQITGDGLSVTASPLTGGTVDAQGDHRIAMAAAIGAAWAAGDTVLKGAEAVGKSYPRFWEDYRRLGGKYHVI